MMFISLYTSRIILKALGVVDMGIYNIVGSIVSFLAFINNSMSISVQRFLTYEMGRNNLIALRTTFNLSVLIHVIIAAFIFIVSETFGFIFLENILNIPPERTDAAIFVFHISIITCLIGIIRVPFNAAIIAYEKMDIFAYLSITDALTALGIAYYLSNCSQDRLKAYAVLMMLSSLLILMCYIAYTYRQFKEIRFGIVWDNNLFKKLLGFATWSAMGEFAWSLTLQGVNFVLNIFYGPIANTARGISYQVQSAVIRFVSSFQTAVNPQITKRFAAEEYASLHALVYRSTCFSYYLLLIISLPLLLSMDYVLSLWLDEVPRYTTIFCRLILINCLLDTLSNLLASVVKAYGRIRNYQIIVSLILMLNLPLSYIALKCGMPVYSIYIVYAIISVALLITRLILLHTMIKFPVKEFFKKVILKLLLLTSLIVPVSLLIYIGIGSNNLPDFILTSALVVIATGVIIYILGIDKNEKEIIKKTINKIVHKQ